INSILDVSANLIMVLDAEGKIIRVNKATEEITGYKIEELLNKYVYEVVVREEKIGKIKEYFNNMTVETIPKTHKKQFFTKNGEKRIISMTNAPILDSEGNIEFIVVAGSDITKLEESIEHVKKVNEALKTITRILRHDLNNVLLVIEGLISTYLEADDSHFLIKALNAVTRGFSLIEEMSTLEESMETGQKLKVMRAEDVVNKVIVSNIGEKVDFNLSGTGEVLADEVLISVFANLVSNAIKHGKADKISIDIKTNEDNVEIVVKDNGIGIHDDIKHRIFNQSFSHGESAGTGLGLFIVKKAMEKYGGDVVVSDNDPNGAVFTLTFPKVNNNKYNDNTKSTK
ncbi:MAG: ATP-binding protein, partial [Candidatus Heimdallarchaeaceae archaeon]